MPQPRNHPMVDDRVLVVENNVQTDSQQQHFDVPHHPALADIILTVGSHANTRRFGVFRAALEVMVPQFKTVLNEPTALRIEVTQEGLVGIALPQDSPDAFALVLAIIFQQREVLVQVPERTTLLALAHLCSKYGMLEFVKPQVEVWARKHHWADPSTESSKPLEWFIDYEKMLKAGYIFENRLMFAKALRELALYTLLDQNNDLIWDPNFLVASLLGSLDKSTLIVDKSMLPPGVESYIKTTKVQQLEGLIAAVRSYATERFNGTEVECSKNKQPCHDKIVMSMARGLKVIGIPAVERPRKRAKLGSDIEITSENISSSSDAFDQLNIKNMSLGRLAFKLEKIEVVGLCRADKNGKKCCLGSSWRNCISAGIVLTPKFTLRDAQLAGADEALFVSIKAETLA